MVLIIKTQANLCHQNPVTALLYICSLDEANAGVAAYYGIYYILYGNVEADGGCNVLVVASLDWRCFLSVATSRPESHNFKVGQPHVCYAVTAAGRYDRQS